MTKAPTVIAKIRGFTLFGQDGILTYAGLEKGEGIVLIREPDNPVDRNAIITEKNCEDCGGHAFAYIDRHSAQRLAPWIDRGWVYTGIIVREADVMKFGPFSRLNPKPEAEVKCIPHQPLTSKQKRKTHAPV